MIDFLRPIKNTNNSMIYLLNSLPEEVSYVREYALKYGRGTKEETSNLIHEKATREELIDLSRLERLILENNHIHLDILMEFIEANLDTYPEEVKKLNSFIWSIMAVSGN
jgi:hypothetical protein